MMIQQNTSQYNEHPLTSSIKSNLIQDWLIKPPPIDAAWEKPANVGALSVRTYGHTVIGALGEAIVAAWLRRGGYDVRMTSGTDLAVTNLETGELLRVEVKTARRDAEGRCQATLYKRGKTHIANSDHLILLCVANGITTPFSIPASRLIKLTHISITSDPQTYAGRWAEYRVGWGVDPL